MANIPISQFWQGINSGQPENRRNSGYCENIYNAALETLKGSSKRSPLILVSGETNTISDDATIINIQGARIIIETDSVRAIDENGNKIDVEDSTGTNFSYISTIRDNLDYAVSLDTAFIVNRTIDVVAVDGIDYTVKLEVGNYDDLPRSTNYPEDPVEGAYYKVVSRINQNPVGYYKYENSVYTRVSEPNDKEVNFDLTTMPHRFVYFPNDNKIIYSTIPFDSRLSGNYKSNKIIPIVGKKILSINYFQSRLVLLTEDNINLSENKNIYNLFVNDLDDITVQDRISIDILESNIGSPLTTVNVFNSMLILCQNAVLCFDAENGTVALTNANGSVRKITDLKCVNIKPGFNGSTACILDINNYIYVFKVLDPRIGPQEVINLNDYDPKLLRNKTVKQLLLDRNELYVINTDGSMLIHKSEEQGQQYVQLAWSRFTSRCHTPLHVDSWNGKIRFVSRCLNDNIAYTIFDYDTNVFGLDPYQLTYEPRLDAREYIQGIYNPKTDETYFEHSVDDADLNYSCIVDSSSGEFFKPKRVSEQRAYFNGLIEGYVYLGFTYEYRTDLTNLWAGANDIRLIGSRLSIFVQDSTDLNVIVIEKNNRERSKQWTNFKSNFSSIGANIPISTVFDLMIVGDTRYNRLSFRSDSPGPLTVNAINYRIQGKSK